MNKLIITSFSILITPFCYADIWGVEDAILIAKATEQLAVLKGQYKTLKETYDKSKKQLTELDNIKKMGIGNYGWGQMQNTLGDLKQREWSPSSWENALKNIAGGNPERYKKLVDSYEKQHKTLSDTDFLKGASKEKLEEHKQSRKINRAANIQSTYAFNDINNHLKEVYKLSSKIEKTKNTKSAMDLNSRLLAEIAYIQTQNLKMQAVLNQQASQSGARELSSESQSASFNRLPDE